MTENLFENPCVMWIVILIFYLLLNDVRQLIMAHVLLKITIAKFQQEFEVFVVERLEIIHFLKYLGADPLTIWCIPKAKSFTF